MKRLELKPVYTVAEIAEACGVSSTTMARWLRREGVRLSPRYPTRGSRIRVHFNSLVKWSEWSDLWESHRLVADWRRRG